MAVSRINQEIAKSLSVENSQVPPWCVCKATLEEWITYQEAENQELRSSRMEWVDGEIIIVELPSGEHGDFVGAFDTEVISQPVVRRYLKSHRDAYVSNRPPRQPRYEADDSFGPRPRTGSRLPIGLTNFRDWRTLVLEVGYSRGWGTQRGYLDWKVRKWSRVRGVRFVVCVAVTENLATAEYKLYTVLADTNRLPDLAPQPIVAPSAEIRFDARELLGLEPGDPIPQDPSGLLFPDPLVVDLYQVLQEALN
ncbi:hypothetical protein P3T76_007085 [Phytophthora citrophthora]|uniref:Restriction endonuclease domain-containing protein n=1 Tax=Phytophthora citrophthora TaxID=4793 RepID=A0AAD9GLX5_9STRA|nr:hypothetical protein P3T76_007085 [Phytophthora citrophthora]